ncbi:MAG: hypothetical protein OES79_02740 [Planctomycetota bacterium]|nr:hypothetical protein [Planctomycetota bacterium]
MVTPQVIVADQPVKPLRDDLTDFWSRGWKSPAPRDVSKAYQRGNIERGWKLWRDYLRRRKRPADLVELWSGKTSPLLWVLPVELEDGDTVRLIQQLHKFDRRKNHADQDVVEQMAPWLDESSERRLDVAHGLECLAWSHALVRLAGHTEHSLWWELLKYLIAAAGQATALPVHQFPIQHTLFAGELALSLACQFPELKRCDRLAGPAREALSRALVELLDGEGMPHARLLSSLPLLTAAWTRCRSIGEQLKKGCWNADAEQQYQWLVTQNLRLAGASAAAALAEPLAALDWRPLMNTAIQLAGDEADEEIANEVLPGRKATRRPRHRWPDPSYSSEWGELAVLQTHWSRRAKKLVVAYDTPDTRVAVCARGQTLISGPWSFDIQLDGEPLVPAADAAWEQVAWESDEEVDYLELEIDLPRGLRLQRSFLLARDDQFLLMADTLLGEHPLDIDYTSRLQLAGDVEAVAEPEHSEMKLVTSRCIGCVLPLALSEWSSDRRFGTLRAEGQSLVVNQTGRQSLFVPLFIDLRRQRSKKPLTWRQLSIGFMRKNEPADRAVGYRVQIGDQQWLIYRSLTPPENRTVLGQNLMCDMHVSRFLSDGDVEELLELE